MSGAGSQQGTPALFHEDSGRPERTAVGGWAVTFGTARRGLGGLHSIGLNLFSVTDALNNSPPPSTLVSCDLLER